MRRLYGLFVVAGLCGMLVAALPGAADVPLVLERETQTPVSLSDLRSVQDRVEAVVEQVQAATVALQVGMGTGSGVIVSEDGYVLTAAPRDR